MATSNCIVFELPAFTNTHQGQQSYKKSNTHFVRKQLLYVCKRKWIRLIVKTKDHIILPSSHIRTLCRRCRLANPWLKGCEVTTAFRLWTTEGERSISTLRRRSMTRGSHGGRGWVERFRKTAQLKTGEGDCAEDNEGSFETCVGVV